MMRAIGLAASVVLCVGHAHAQSCGGSGSSDSGGGSSGGGSSGGGGGGSADAGGDDVCTDSTEITGLEKCTRFGRGWDVSHAPSLSLGLSLGARSLSLGGIRVEGTSTHDDNPYRWSLTGSDLADPDVTAVVTDIRASLFLTDHAYVAAELELGGGSAAGPTVYTGEVALTPTSAALIGGSGGLGLRIRAGVLALRAEVLGGIRAVALTFESRRGACVTTTSAWTSAAVVEPRFAVDVFATPWLTVGAFVGGDAVDGLAWHGGLSVAIHARSFDGS